MSNRVSIRLAWGVAFAVLLVGVAMSLRTLTGIRDTERKLNTALKALEDLGTEEARMREYASAAGAFKEIDASEPVDIEKIAKARFKTPSLDIRETIEPSIAGWQVRKSEISLKNIQLSTVGDFVNAVEAYRPPLRLKRCTIRATPSAGAGDAVLEIEQICKRRR